MRGRPALLASIWRRVGRRGSEAWRSSGRSVTSSAPRVPGVRATPGRVHEHGCALRLRQREGRMPAETGWTCNTAARDTGDSHATRARHYSGSCPHSPGVPGGGRCRRGGSGWVVAFSSPRPEGRSAPRAASGRHRQRQSVSQPTPRRPRGGGHDLRRAGTRTADAAHPRACGVVDDSGRPYLCLQASPGRHVPQRPPGHGRGRQVVDREDLRGGAKGERANYIAGIAKIDVLDAATRKFTMEKPTRCS